MLVAAVMEFILQGVMQPVRLRVCGATLRRFVMSGAAVA